MNGKCFKVYWAAYICVEIYVWSQIAALKFTLKIYTQLVCCSVLDPEVRQSTAYFST
jgi:hypothetical protein